MTTTLTLARLKTRLETITPPNPPGTALHVFSKPQEAVKIGNFPTLVLGLAPQVDHAWRIEALGLGRHDYQVAMYLFLGPRQMSLPELHARAEPWPELLARALLADITLSGAVMFIGPGDQAWDGSPFFTYRIQPIPWADGIYFGIKALLPVTEKPLVTMG